MTTESPAVISSAVSSAPLSVSHVSKSFGNKKVLTDISLELNPAEIFGLIGLNGIGKTTLIKIILDLLNADEGEVSLFGVPSSKVESRQKLSYLPEKFAPSRYLRGTEYLDLSLSFYRHTLNEEEAMKGAELLDLDPKALNNLVGSYSKGMGQKLGLLGAFMVDAPLMVLDEPMSGLDPRARIFLKKKMLEARAQGKTIFFSSHILADIDQICDRIGILHDGQMLFLGTPKEFKAKYQEENLEEAFLTSINAKDAA